MTTSTYEHWSKEDLIARLRELEKRPNGPRSSRRSRSPAQRRGEFNFSSYPRRKIALKFCYSGWEYNGLAFQLTPTPLPTVEGVIYEAMTRAKLIDPVTGYDGCGWEKCGRTDRGVSAAGQVISLWVRSALEENLDVEKTLDASSSTAEKSASDPKPDLSVEEEPSMLDDGFGSLVLNDSDEDGPSPPVLSSSSRPELDYVAILNRLLPPTIRILAWSPVSPTFSARFACKFRHYKYFFSSEHLDISQMRDASSRLLGLHDFRNLCKLDTAKQITAFDRRILRADIEQVDPVAPAASSMHVFNLVGTAFLYHQVRHIMAVLFMVGRGLEHPSVMSALLNVKEGSEQPREGETLEVVASKPEYQMADALPLMLWDCGYSEDDVDWRTDGHHDQASALISTSTSAEDGRGLYHLLYSLHERSEVQSALNKHFLDAASVFFPPPWATTSKGTVGIRVGGSVVTEVPLGGGTSRRRQQYVPLLKRLRLDSVEVMNERYRNGKGFRREQKTAIAEEEDDEGDE